MILNSMKYFLLLVLFYFIKCLTPLILVSADDNYKCSKISSGDNHLGIILNDEFCDCEDCSDETNTLVGFRKYNNKNKNLYRCIASGSLNISIPTSRVHDGICDCCDGADEKGSMYNVTCENTCQTDLVTLKQTALLLHRQIQAGIRSRRDIVDIYRKSKLREKRSYESLIEESKDLTNLIVYMKNMLQRDGYLESKLRFTLIRQRQSRCAYGSKRDCNFFHSEYFEEDDLEGYGLPFDISAEKTKDVKQATTGHKDYLATLSSLERTRQSYCPIKVLLPDDSAKIFTTLGPLLSFHKSKGGILSRNRVRDTIRKETLFQPYLDDKEFGFTRFMIVLTEFSSVIISPVLIACHILLSVNDILVQSFWLLMESCSTDDRLYLKITEFCKFSMSYHDENSQLSQFLGYFDYSSYSALSTLYDTYIHPILRTPKWIASIAWRAPRMYYDFYIGDKANLLPPKRHQCLLREGIKFATEEVKVIKAKIKEEDEIKLLRETMMNPEHGNLNILSSKKVVDYGVNNDWEALTNVCINKKINDYNYNYCFFKDIKQDHILVGTYKGWGKIDDTKEENLKNKKSDDLKIEDAYYSHQIYNDGDMCPVIERKPFSRSANIEYSCGLKNDIIEVIEVEKCVYQFKISTPIACTDYKEKESLERLEFLGVFGYKKQKKEIEIN